MKGGESHEENHHPAVDASDERVFGGKVCGNLVKYANRADGRNKSKTINLNGAICGFVISEIEEGIFFSSLHSEGSARHIAV